MQWPIQTHHQQFRLAELAWKAEETGVDGILFTCSSFTPYVSKIAQLISVPVLSSDISMLDLAVETGEKIGVIATVSAAGPTTERMLHEVAQRKHKEIDIETHVLLDAFRALQNDESDIHDQLVIEKIKNIYNENDIVALAQYSMARVHRILSEDIKGKVITGPSVSAQAIVREAKQYVSRGVSTHA